MNDDTKFFLNGTLYLVGLFSLLFALSGAAEASDTDGILSYGQCMRVEKTHGNPCIHQAKVFVSVGFGDTDFFGNGAYDGGVNYFAGKRKTRYATDGTPSQCTNPCLPCKGDGCKYECKGYKCHWEPVGNDFQSGTLSTADL